MKKQVVQRSLMERIAWWCILAVPAVVPVFVSKLPLVAGNPITFNPFGVPKLFALGILVSVALICWAIALITGQVQLRDVKAKWFALGLLGLTAASTVMAVSPSTSMFGGQGQYVGVLTLLLCGALALLVTQLTTGRARLLQLTRAAVIGGTIVGTIGVLQAVGADFLRMPLEEAWMLTRGSSTIGNPDLTGTYLVVPLLLAIALSFAEEHAGWKRTAVVSSAVIASALTLTLTRGAWIGAIVGAGVFAFALARSSVRITRRAKQVALGVGAIIVATGALMGSQLLSRFTELASGRSAGSGRLVLWTEAVKILTRYPLLGTGPDGYVYGWWKTHALAGAALGGPDFAVSDPHNAMLYLAATLGVPALLVFGALVFVVLRGGASAAFTEDAKRDRLVFSGWWAATAGLAIALFFSVSTLVAITMFWLCLAVVAISGARQVTAPRWATYSVAVVCVGLAVFSAVTVSMYLASDRSLAKELDGNREGNSREAVSRAPWNYQARYHYAYELYSQTVLSRPVDGPQVKPLYDRADQAARELIGWNPHEDDSYVLLLKLQTEAGTAIGPDAAESALLIADEGLVNHPASLVIPAHKAIALYLLERYPEMVSTLQGIWDVNPHYSLPGTLYAQALIATGQKADAAAVLAELTTRFPGDTEVARVQSILDAK